MQLCGRRSIHPASAAGMHPLQLQACVLLVSCPILNRLLHTPIWPQDGMSHMCQQQLMFSLSCTHLFPAFHPEAWMPLRQGEPASKGAAAPAKKAEPAAKKAPEADHQPPAPAPAQSKSRHGRKPQRDQQSANQALQLFSHLQQYRVGVPCSSPTFARICRVSTHHSAMPEPGVPGRVPASRKRSVEGQSTCFIGYLPLAIWSCGLLVWCHQWIAHCTQQSSPGGHRRSEAIVKAHPSP